MQEKKHKNVLWGNITFLQFHNMLKMNIFSLAENIHSGNTLVVGDLVRFFL